MGISRIFAVLVIRQNDLPPIYDWCARATFYRTLLSVQGIVQEKDQTEWSKEIIQLADNKYKLTLFRLIKVYMTKGTLEE